MGMYTTQLRTICESVWVANTTDEPALNRMLYSDYNYTYLKNVSAGSTMTPYKITELDVVQKKIFEEYLGGTAFKTLYPLFDDNYRPTLQQKILLHYYTREICEETFALWKLRLISKLNDIMPYYNKLYTETFEKYLGNDYNLFDNVDMEITDNFDKKIERMVENVLNEQMKNKNTSETNSEEEHSGTDTTKYKKHYTKDLGGVGYTDSIPANSPHITKQSDTPQGSVDHIGGGYLSQASEEYGTIVKRDYNVANSRQEQYNDSTGSQDEFVHDHTINNSESNVNNSSRNTTANNNENEEAKEKSKTNRRTKGKSNFQSYASILKEIRESIINVDKMVIDELEPLFFGLW